MDINFLKEYECGEDSLRNIPINSRLTNLSHPIFHLEQKTNSIWSQIAFSGTVLFPLFPFSSDKFKQLWNIDEREIPRLVEFARETKKIQFLLMDNPTEFIEFDYLEPIFQELAPPMYYDLSKFDHNKFDNLRRIHEEEFETLIEISPKWLSVINKPQGKNAIKSDLSTYTWLRYYGFNDIADNFIDNFLLEPEFAHLYINLALRLIIGPIREPLQANRIFNIDTLNKASNMGLISDMSINDISFYEVGTYLMRKCTYYPESLEACKNLISLYEDNDLYKVNASLQKAIVDRNELKVLKNKEDIGDILDNVWEDKKIKRSTMAISYGTDIVIGTVGYSIGGVPGLLGSIGMEIIDNKKCEFIDRFSELVAKKIALPYMAAIYDFKKKYRIDK